MQLLVAMVQETGRYPSRNAKSTSERTLAVWLQRRREDARAGRLAPAFREGLAVLPGWEGKPRVEADEKRWHQRLAALKAYRAAGNDWPRHKAVITGEELSSAFGCTARASSSVATSSTPTKQLPWTPTVRVGGLAGSAVDLLRPGSYSRLPRRSQSALRASSSSHKGASFRLTRRRYRK